MEPRRQTRVIRLPGLPEVGRRKLEPSRVIDQRTIKPAPRQRLGPPQASTSSHLSSNPHSLANTHLSTNAHLSAATTHLSTKGHHLTPNTHLTSNLHPPTLQSTQLHPSTHSATQTHPATQIHPSTNGYASANGYAAVNGYSATNGLQTTMPRIPTTATTSTNTNSLCCMKSERDRVQEKQFMETVVDKLDTISQRLEMVAKLLTEAISNSSMSQNGTSQSEADCYQEENNQMLADISMASKEYLSRHHILDSLSPPAKAREIERRKRNGFFY